MSVSLTLERSVATLSGFEPAREDDAERYIAALHAVTALEEGFALLVELAVPILLSPEQKKAQNLWYKASRERLNRACVACAIVRPTVDEEMQRTFQGLFAFPLLATRDRAEAQAFLARHLAGRALA